MKNLLKILFHIKLVIEVEEKREPQTSYSQGWTSGALYVYRSVVRAIKLDKLKEGKNESKE